MSNGIAKIENNVAVAWASIHDGQHCATFFGADPIPDPLPAGYVYADSLDAAKTNAENKTAEVLEWFDAAISSGWLATLYSGETVIYQPGWKLGITTEDRNEFDAQATALTLQLLLGANAAEIPVTFYPLAESGQRRLGTPVTLTADVYLALINEGGKYYQTLLAARESYMARIDDGDLNFTPGL